MTSTADFRNGMVIVAGTNLMEIIEFQHVKPGKGGAFVRTKLKNVISGRVLEKTFRAGERMEEARLVRESYEYLYTDGDLFHFMHRETYDQMALSSDLVGDMKNWLKPNDPADVLFHGEKPLRIELQSSVKLEVTKSDPGVQGDRSQGGTKPATLETGVTVQVPLFVNPGDVIKVDTRTGAYLERASS